MSRIDAVSDMTEAHEFHDPLCQQADFLRIARIMREETGITLSPDSMPLVVSRLIRQVQRLQLPDFASFVKFVSSPPNRAELTAMVSALTTNTTRFFREPLHYDIFVRDLLDDIRRRAIGGARVRLWSAGCSSGEEAYSLAATLLHHWPDVGAYDVRILATDICDAALEAARAARYTRDRLEAVPDDVRPLMLADDDGTGDQVVLPAAIRNLVTVRYLNFIQPWPVSGPFDAIFCRNVAIYMDTDVQLHIWSGISDLLRRDGLLFIGHSERLPASFAPQLALIDRTTFRRL